MLTAEQSEEIEYIKDRMLAKFPLLGVTVSQLEVVANDSVGTAMTTGDKIYYSPSFFSTLSDDEAIFTFAHEVFHVAFEHIFRSKGKDMDLWNIATDAVINQLLKQEGLPIKKGLVDIPEALGLSAEEMYAKLLELRQEKEREWQEHLREMQEKAKEMGEKQRKEQNAGQNEETADTPKSMEDWARETLPNQEQRTDASPQDKEAADTPSQDDEATDTRKSMEDWVEETSPRPHLPEFEFNLNNHDCWQESAEEMSSELEHVEDDLMQNMEKRFCQQNRQEQFAQAEEYADETDAIIQRGSCSGSGRSIDMAGEDLSESTRKVVDWKKILQENFDKEEEIWSDRRADEDNDFASRLEELEQENHSITEVMLDVSGSVNINLLKEFLRQLKPLLKSSKLKVGCFDEYFYGLQEIKTNRDIDNFRVTSESGWTENWDLAVRSFSKGRHINKIIFTDGYPAPGVMPKSDLKKEKVIWIVYGNKSFHPCCGKVIYVDEDTMRGERLIRSSLLGGMKKDQGR